MSGGADEGVLWRGLLDAELRQRDAISRTVVMKPPSPAFREGLRRWWGAAEAVLAAYTQALSDGRTLTPPPLDVLFAMKSYAGYLAVGKIPGPIADAAKEGRCSPGPAERRDVGFVVLYITAATTGYDNFGERITLVDETPIKTVGAAFGVSARTVHDWKKTFEPSSPGNHRADGNLLLALMIKAGKRYKAGGRSSQAIAARGPAN